MRDYGYENERQPSTYATLCRYILKVEEKVVLNALESLSESASSS